MNGHHISKRRQGTPANGRGFTIVELLVVIVVVGILAAVTIVAYNGVQNSAAEAALQSDLQTAAATLAIDNRKNGSYPSSESAADNGKGLKTSNGATFEYSSVYDGKAYCLSATSNRNGVPGYSVSSDGAKVEQGVCAGHAEPETNSSAGTTWEVGVFPHTNTTGPVAYSNGKFVIGNFGGTNMPAIAYASADGSNWSSPANIGTASTSGIKVAALNGHFIALFSTGTVISAISTGGTNWLHTGAAATMSSYQIIDAAYGNGAYVGIRSTPPTTYTSVQSSTNGVNWTTLSTSVPWSSWSSVTYGAGRFVAVAQSGTPNMMTSEDGVTWTARAAPEANAWTSVVYADGLFVAVAASGTNRVMTSPDGITWTARPAAQANEWRAVTYGNGKYVALASSGTNRIMTSKDGINWTLATAPRANYWNSVTYGNGCFVATASSGTDRLMKSCK